MPAVFENLLIKDEVITEGDKNMTIFNAND